jgi:uncharacterized protein (TIGR02265 family)
MLDSKPQVKGILFLARLGFLREQGGELLAQALDELEPGAASALRGSISPDAWYPLDLLHRVDSAIVSMLPGHDREDVLVQIGRASADAILVGYEGRHIQRRAPKSFLESVPNLYSALHTGGRREYKAISRGAAVVRTFCEPCSAVSDDCWTIVGWLQRGLELFGADAVLVKQISSRAGGAPACEFHCEWR